MIKKIKKGQGSRGTLNIIAGLLIASAFVRLSANIGPALANETIEGPETEQQSTTPPMRETDEENTNALLEAFQRREARIVEQEAMLRDRMQALRVAEIEITEKLAMLEQAEADLAATIALADSAAETDLGRLTTVYENMKPKEAALLFEEMPPQFAAGFLGMMQPDAAASIMTQLSPETAYSFSVVLAGRNAGVPTE